MIEHLSPGQLTRWAMGERDAAARKHVESCAVCRGRAAGFDEAAQGFRAAIHQWSEERMPAGAAWTPARRAPWWHVGTLRWALLTATVCIAVSLSIVRVGPRPQLRDSVDPDALLIGIDTAISRPVPVSMQPLMQLVSAAELNSTRGARN